MGSGVAHSDGVRRRSHWRQRTGVVIPPGNHPDICTDVTEKIHVKIHVTVVHKAKIYLKKDKKKVKSQCG